MEVVCSSITIPTTLSGVITQDTIFLLLGLTVDYEIEPVGAGGGWYLGFLVWDNSFGV
jgi:hypothetical protein